MGQWVFLAGDEQSSYNDKSRVYLYDTVAAIARSGDTQLTAASGDVSLTVIGDYLYFSPWAYAERQTPTVEWLAVAARSLLSDADTLVTRYYGGVVSSGYSAGYSRPVLFNGFTLFASYVVQATASSAIIKTNGESVSTVVTLSANCPPVLVGLSGQLVAVYTSGGRIYTATSANGVSFTSGTVQGAATANFGLTGRITLWADIYPSSYGLAIATDGYPIQTGIFTSNGGSTWSAATNLPTGVTGVYAYSSGAYATAGSHLYKTTNGTAWTDVGEPLGGEVINDIAFGNSQYMLVGNNGGAATTTDFSTFTPFSGADFNYHHIYAAVYTASTIAVTPVNSGTLQATSSPDTAVIQGSFSAATGSIAGTLRLDTSSGVFAARTVYLYSYTTGAKIAETVSNASDGVWEFSSVAPGEYFVVGVAQAGDLTIPRDFDALGVITVT
jgi:hypothetical protein